MSQSDSTCIGRVRHVLGAQVTVALDQELAGVAPLWRGRLQAVGQVGSLVRLPQGPVDLLATVDLVGIAEVTRPPAPALLPAAGERWLQVQLLGEIDALRRFHRGVTKYPALDDAVHFVTPAELAAVFPVADERRVRLGALVAASGVPLTLDADSLVMRHGALVGSTGSGKTSAAVSLIQSFVRGGWKTANIVVIDPHGEYAPALTGVAAVRSVLSEADERLLRVPYWALPAADILRAFCGPVENQTILTRFSELVAEHRRVFADDADWIDVDPSAVSPDTPIPFDIRDVWSTLDRDNKATFSQSQGSGAPQVIEDGDAETLKPWRFEPPAMGAAAPFRGPTLGHYGTIPDRLRARLLDSRFRFLLEPSGATDHDALLEVVQEWLGEARPVSVLDFSGVPADAADLAIGTVLQLLFEIAVRSRDDGIGRPRPVFIVLEEAHRYLGDAVSAHVARDAANRIAREGRKYGVGLLLVTQRPSELPATALAQCGTIIALRLTNGTDQATVRAALPDTVSGLAGALSALRTGEALVSGEAVVLPTRVLVDLPDPEPDAADPSLASWRQEAKENQLAEAIARWRGF